jgi:hypothetical protein
MQKRIVWIMLSCRRLASCRNLFNKLKILPERWYLNCAVFYLTEN